MKDTKQAVKTVGIKILDITKYIDGSYIDFVISLNGEEPADLYRIYSWENEFHKTIGLSNAGHAVRGKARKAATELILQMRANGCPVGMIEYI